MTEFEKAVFEAVKTIPKGSVATYGDIAFICGYPNGARAVGNALHKNTDPIGVPCHRVVNAKGQLAPHYVFGGVEEQAKRLEQEGITIIDGYVAEFNKIKLRWHYEKISN